jgi:hypothetical protein
MSVAVLLPPSGARRIAPPVPALVLALAALAGCSSEDTIARGRGDSGVAAVDGGSYPALPLMAGWTFTYRATLTRREGRSEKSAAYELNLTIASVEDRGAAGGSRVSVTATGMNTFEQSWDPTAGADSWVARLGPAGRGETVAATPASFDLDRPPGAPALPKQLPSDRVFFVDLRSPDALGAAFVAAHSTELRPRALAPDPPSRSDWQLALDGRDPEMIYYPDAVKQRAISLNYDPRGFLVSMTERLGDSFDPVNPNGRFELTLMSARP